MRADGAQVGLGIYEATLIRIATKPGKSVADGAKWVFKLSNGHVMAFYSKPLVGCLSDTRGSLKLVAHFLDYAFTDLKDCHIDRLAGRFIRLIVARKIINGKEVPVISGFAFSTRQLFAYGANGNRSREDPNCQARL